MFAPRFASLTLTIGLLGGLAAQAAENPLAAFPKDAGVVVRLKSPQKTIQKAGDLAVKVDRQEGVKVQFALPALGFAISNPSLEGVDKGSDWWLAVFPVANQEPGVVFCIPATDAELFQKNVTGDYEFQTYEKWLIYTEHAATAKKLKTHIAAKGASVSGLMDDAATSVWNDGDLSIFINAPQILKVYRGPFDEGVRNVEQFIEQFPSIVPQQQQNGVDMKAIADLYSSMFHGLVQAVNDAQGCTAGLAISESGVSIHEYLSFADNSKTSKALTNHKPTKLANLNQLPANQAGYGAAEIDMSALVKWSMKYSLQMMAKDDTEKENQIKDLIKKYEKIEFQTMAASFNLGNPKQGAMRMAAIVDVKNAQDIRKLSQESSKIMSDYSVGGMKMKLDYKPEAETYGDLKADVVRMKYEIDPQNPGAQMQEKMNEMLYGPEGMVTRTIYLKDRMAQTVGGNKADAQALLNALDGKNNVGEQPAFQATRKQLLPEANIIGILDIPGTLSRIMEIAIQAGAPVPLNDDDLKTIRGETSYAGFSLGTTKNGLKAKTVVPLQQMQGIARFVKTVREAEQQRQ